MTAEKLNNFGRMMAFFSFMIGTGIFAYSFISTSLEVLITGFGYLVSAFLFNIATFFIVLKKAMEDDANREELIATIGVIILNIPIALLYVWIRFTIG